MDTFLTRAFDTQITRLVDWANELPGKKAGLESRTVKRVIHFQVQYVDDDTIAMIVLVELEPRKGLALS